MRGHGGTTFEIFLRLNYMFNKILNVFNPIKINVNTKCLLKKNNFNF